MAGKDVIDTCCVLLWLMSYEHTRGSQSAPQLVKKARVCAGMSMWLVHIKEHVVCQNMFNHDTSICHEWVCEWVLHWKADGKEVLPHMRWQACMLPRELIWEGVASPQEKVEWHSMESGLSRKTVKQHLKIYKREIINVLYKCMKWNEIDKNLKPMVHKLYKCALSLPNKLEKS